MKYLAMVMLLFTNIAFAGDLGVFSDGGKDSYRIYYQTDAQIIIRKGAKVLVYDQKDDSRSNTFSSSHNEVYGTIQYLDDYNLIWNDEDTVRFLTKMNNCK